MSPLAPLTHEQKSQLEHAVGSAIAIVDWLIRSYKLNRANIVAATEAARKSLENTYEASDD